MQHDGRIPHTHASQLQPSQPGPGSAVQPSKPQSPQSSGQSSQLSSMPHSPSPQKLHSPQSSAHEKQSSSMPLQRPSPHSAMPHCPQAGHASWQQSPNCTHEASHQHCPGAKPPQAPGAEQPQSIAQPN